MLFVVAITVVVVAITQISLDAGNSSNRNWVLVAYVFVCITITVPWQLVTILVTWGQSAWAITGVAWHQFSTTSFSSSETTRETFKHVGPKNDTTSWRHQWLVGVTDGDGTFHFSKSANGKWGLSFKISQNTYNLRLLHHIKSIVGVGEVVVSGDNDMASFRVRRITNIVQYVLPVFDENPLLTSKYFNYALFKRAALIMTNSSLSTSEKDAQLTELKKQEMPNNYVSPAWAPVNYNVSCLTDAITVMSKPWLVGFTEAEGSFFLVLKGPSRLVHSFSISQKLDEVVLTADGYILGMSVTTKKTYKAIGTSNQQTVSSLVDYFFNTMKGVKSLEYRIWARSFTKSTRGSKGFTYLNEVRDQMRKLRSVRYDKNFQAVYCKRLRNYSKKSV